MKGERRWCFWIIFIFSQFLKSSEQGFLHQYTNDGKQMNISLRMKRSHAVDISDDSNDCNTDICKKLSAEMLLSLDHNSDACEDFHKYVCGGNDGVTNNNFINQQYKYIEQYLQEQLQQFSTYFKMFYDFKESCVNYQIDFDIIEKVKFARDYVGTNLTGVFIDLILTQSLPLFDIGVGIGKSSNYEFQITIPGKSSLKTNTDGWSLFDYIKKDCQRQQRFINKPKANYDLDEMYKALKKCEQNVLEKKVREFFNVSKLAAAEFTGDMKVDDLIDLLSKLRNIMPSENEIRKDQISNHYEEISLGDLGKKFNVLDWKTLFQGIARDVSVQDDQIIQVHFSNYLNKMFQLFRSYEMGRLVKILRQFYSLQFYHNLVAARNEDRFTYCMDLVCQLMPDVTNLIMYEIHRSDSQGFTYWNFLTKQLFEDLKQELGSAIEGSAIEETSKKLLKNKLDMISLGMITSGNTNFTRDNEVEVSIRKDNFQNNLLSLLKQFRRTVYSLVNANVSPASLLNYFISPFYDQPLSFYQSKYIVFHPAIYYKIPMNLPENLRVAKAGLHFARELAKHFDLTGRNFLTNGVMTSSDSFYEFLQRQTNELMNTVYLKSPYKLQKSQVSFQNSDGELLVNELIVDNTAFRIIWDVYKKTDKESIPWVSKTFSPDQIFFIFSAQEYCEQTTKEDFMIDLLESRRVPSEIKIHNIISNSVEFAKTFDCPEGSAMLFPDPNMITQFPYIQPDDEYADPDDYE